MAQTKTVSKIKVEKPDERRLNSLKVFSWPIWTKGPSTFDWHYDETETCYFLEGEVSVKTYDGEITIGKGDLVRFPAGLDCSWHISRAVRKHYSFGD